MVLEAVDGTGVGGGRISTMSEIIKKPPALYETKKNLVG